MNISIFGLGYVGCVSLGCLAKNGFSVIGVDVSEQKVNLVNSGKPTIIEKDIDVIISQNHAAGMIRATTDYRDAVRNSEVSIICVGTPNTKHGDLNLDYIFETAKQIGQSLKSKDTFHTIVIRSTVLPGTNSKVRDIIASNSGKTPNMDFTVVSNPEFLREGSAVEDYYNPPLTVIGCDNDMGFSIVESLYKKVSGPIERVDIAAAEIIKYINNSYHALKVVFANEIGAICKKMGIDSHEAMRLFCMDKQLNISTYYFKPGFAYGGSCLPKDLKALNTLALDNDLSCPVLGSIEQSNHLTIDSVTQKIMETKLRKIGVLGVSFKSGTDDMRFSPIISVIESLIGKGFEVRAFDENVNLARIIGSNKEYLDQHLPHIEKTLVNTEQEVTEWSEVIVINTKDIADLESIKANQSLVVFDLVRVAALESCKNYNGLAW